MIFIFKYVYFRCLYNCIKKIIINIKIQRNYILISKNYNYKEKKMKTFAISLYDNDAESEDELTFRKNDLIQVLNVNYMGMDGWWLCKLIKTNQVGLAAGNRLKIINDEKLLDKIQKLLVINNNNNQKSSSSSATSPTTSTASSCSVTSSSSNSLDSTSNSTSCIYSTTTSRLQTLSLQPTTPSHKPLVLPAKTKLAESSENILTLKTAPLSKYNSINSSSKSQDDQDEEEEEDYDYDIPENNKSIKPELNSKTSSSDTRKSTSPTIDSGISTSSLMSLSSTSNEEANMKISKSAKLKLDYESKLDKLNQFLTQNHESNKNLFIEFKHDLNDLIINYLKVIKDDHASFHPNLGVFNKYKTIYRQIKEFYLYYENTMNKFDKLYKWNFDLISKQNEQKELEEKLKYLNLDLIGSINKLINESKMFEYYNESQSNNNSSNKVSNQEEEEESYQYVYDDINSDSLQSNNQESVNTNEDESDYCTIDDNFDSNEIKQAPTPIKTNQYCQTLKKNDEKIRREIRLAVDNNPNEASRVTMCDQMLLKFYLKHIEDNLNELSQIHENLINQLDINDEKNSNNLNEEFNDQAHKLALNGHKLLFICDTLQRNLNNSTIKNCLTESSQELCDSLKFYMIRIKSSKASNNKLVLDSLNNVLNTSNKFKQIILKYYFKSY